MSSDALVRALKLGFLGTVWFVLFLGSAATTFTVGAGTWYLLGLAHFSPFACMALTVAGVATLSFSSSYARLAMHKRLYAMLFAGDPVETPKDGV